jgi:hypothetical protein
VVPISEPTSFPTEDKMAAKRILAVLVGTALSLMVMSGVAFAGIPRLP